MKETKTNKQQYFQRQIYEYIKKANKNKQEKLKVEIEADKDIGIKDYQELQIKKKTWKETSKFLKTRNF